MAAKRNFKPSNLQIIHSFEQFKEIYNKIKSDETIFLEGKFMIIIF